MKVKLDTIELSKNELKAVKYWMKDAEHKKSVKEFLTLRLEQTINDMVDDLNGIENPHFS